MFKEFLNDSKSLNDLQIDGKNRFVCKICGDEIIWKLPSLAEWPYCCHSHNRMEVKPFDKEKPIPEGDYTYIPND